MNKYLEKIAARKEVELLLKSMVEKGKVNAGQDIGTLKGVLRTKTGHYPKPGLNAEEFFQNRKTLRDEVLQDKTSVKRFANELKNPPHKLATQTDMKYELSRERGGYGQAISHPRRNVIARQNSKSSGRSYTPSSISFGGIKAIK